MKYLVTGGAGFIGSHLTEALVRKGNKVNVIDNLLTGKRENIPKSSLIKFYHADIRDQKILMKALDDVNVVFHLCAVTSVPRSVKKPFDTDNCNVDGTMKLLTACVEKKIKKVIFASSSSVYGDYPVLPRDERHPVSALSPYAVSKSVGEIYMKNFAERFGLKICSLRLFNVYGPRQDPESPYSAVIPKFILKLLNNEPLTIYGDGKQTRDFTFVGDVVDAFISAADKRQANSMTLNIATGSPTSVITLARILADIAGVKPKIDYLPKRPGDILHSHADITQAKRVLSFIPRFDLKSGLKVAFDWFKSRYERLWRHDAEHHRRLHSA